MVLVGTQLPQTLPVFNLNTHVPFSTAVICRVSRFLNPQGYWETSHMLQELALVLTHPKSSSDAHIPGFSIRLMVQVVLLAPPPKWRLSLRGSFVF